MGRRDATEAEARETAHTLSHQPWVPPCTWRVIVRDDGSAYVHGTMDDSVPPGEDREALDLLKHRLGGSFRAATAGHARSWHGKYGRTSVCVSAPYRKATRPAHQPLRRTQTPPPLTPCREAELLELVREFIDPDPCEFDHHGYCQAHGYPGGEPLSCPHGRAKRLLNETKEARNEE